MNRFSLIFFLVLIFLTYSCSGQIEIIEANSQEWAGGRPESGFGVKYQLKIIVKKSSNKIILDTLWVENKFYPIEKLYSGKEQIQNFKKGDTLAIYAKQKNYNLQFAPDNYMPDYNKKTPPVKITADAFIQYRIKRKYKYVSIEKFTVLPFLAYP